MLIINWTKKIGKLLKIHLKPLDDYSKAISSNFEAFPSHIFKEQNANANTPSKKATKFERKSVL
jgi:hypothetical protein